MAAPVTFACEGIALRLAALKQDMAPGMKWWAGVLRVDFARPPPAKKYNGTYWPVYYRAPSGAEAQLVLRFAGEKTYGTLGGGDAGYRPRFAFHHATAADVDSIPHSWLAQALSLVDEAVMAEVRMRQEVGEDLLRLFVDLRRKGELSPWAARAEWNAQHAPSAAAQSAAPGFAITVDAEQRLSEAGWSADDIKILLRGSLPAQNARITHPVQPLKSGGMAARVGVDFEGARRTVVMGAAPCSTVAEAQALFPHGTEVSGMVDCSSVCFHAYGISLQVRMRQIERV